MVKDESGEAKRRIMVKMGIMLRAQEAKDNAFKNEGIEREIKKQREQHIKNNMQAIREDQKEALDTKS